MELCFIQLKLQKPVDWGKRGNGAPQKRNTNPINAKLATKATRYHTASSKDRKQTLWTIFTQYITQEIRDQGVMRRTGKKERWQENREWGRGERRERPSNSLLAAQNLQLPHKRSSFRRHGLNTGALHGKWRLNAKRSSLCRKTLTHIPSVALPCGAT